MQLKDLRQEFLFDCQVRELSEKTINPYSKQTDYLVTFPERKCGITELEKFKSLHIKMFISSYQKGKKINIPAAFFMKMGCNFLGHTS